MEDTIAAISTPIGEGGIAIIRISGSQALAIADTMFVSTKGLPSTYRSHTIHLGRVINESRQPLDEVLLTVLRHPYTYTTEDTVEINCHGGRQIARTVLAECLQRGARLAEPGEFTKRAFLNGRIDLTQAEAVMDVISAKTDRAHMAAEQALEGSLSRKVEKLRQQLLSILAHVEAHIDFPEEDISPAISGELEIELTSIIASLEQLLSTSKEGKILREGISVAIVGRPNVGKSSLMNALLGTERSIVTATPGTTRDTIEESANIRGIPVKFIDTAGIRKARGKAEEIGINKSHNAFIESDLCIHVLDISRLFSKTDFNLLKRFDKKNVIRVLNKYDLPHKLILPTNIQHIDALKISTMTGYGIEVLKDRIEKISLNNSPVSFDFEVLINERHSEALQRAIKELKLALADIQKNASIEVISQQIRIGFSIIGEIVGKTTTEDLMEKIFSKFCIGK